MRISGLNSGLDIDQIVSDLVRAQRIPMDRVYQQKVKAEWKRDAYREVNTKLSRFRNLAWNFQLQGTFTKYATSTTKAEVLTAQASASAGVGRYDVKVKGLAEAARVVVDDVNLTAADQFQIQGADGSWVTIAVAEDDTLETIAAKINGEKNLNVYAFAADGVISFTTKNTGSEAVFVVDEDFIQIFQGLDLAESETVTAPEGYEGRVGFLKLGDDIVRGKDAQLEINGVEVSSATNNYELNGITLNLLETGETTVEVRHDVDAVVEQVKEFVNLYNELVDELNSLLREEAFRDYPPLTDEQREAMSDKEIELWEEKAKSGLLRNDSLLSSVLTEMRQALGGVVSELEGKKNLAQIGITTGSWFEYGRLYLNEGKLREALEEDPESVRDIFTHDSKDPEKAGLARRLTAVLDRSMERITDTAGKASVAYDQSFLGRQIREYEDRLLAMEERLIRFEEAQWRKFTAMETALGQLYAQSDWLYQQIAAMQG